MRMLEGWGHPPKTTLGVLLFLFWLGHKEGFAGNPRWRGTGPPTGVGVKMKTWREEVQGKDEKREGK